MFLFTLECRLPENKCDSLVDRIFNDIFRACLDGEGAGGWAGG